MPDGVRKSVRSWFAQSNYIINLNILIINYDYIYAKLNKLLKNAKLSINSIKTSTPLKTPQNLLTRRYAVYSLLL